MKNLRYGLVAMLAGVALVGAACSDDDSDSASEDETTTTAEETTTTAAEEEAGTIVEIAAGTEDFSTLVELVTLAGLDEALSGEGPFTVFAPTNEAFAAVDPATVEALKADPEGALTDVLNLHVISGKVMAADAAAAAGTCVETLGGQVKVEEVDGGLTIGGAPISTTDIEASNGVIHVIDSVITAPSTDC
jgi:uncharacterized surface protein with fasciclin (FAS1) repeats